MQAHVAPEAVWTLAPRKKAKSPARSRVGIGGRPNKFREEVASVGVRLPVADLAAIDDIIARSDGKYIVRSDFIREAVKLELSRSREMEKVKAQLRQALAKAPDTLVIEPAPQQATVRSERTGNAPSREKTANPWGKKDGK